MESIFPTIRGRGKGQGARKQQAQIEDAPKRNTRQNRQVILYPSGLRRRVKVVAIAAQDQFQLRKRLKYLTPSKRRVLNKRTQIWFGAKICKCGKLYDGRLRVPERISTMFWHQQKE